MNAIQWKMVKFDPHCLQSPIPMAIKFGMGDEVLSLSDKGFSLPPLTRIGGRVHTDSANFSGGGALFILFSISPLHRFLRSVRQMTSFRARVCLLWSQKQIIHFDPILFVPKTQISLKFLKGFRQFRVK